MEVCLFMQIKKVPTKDLISPEWNPRQITDEELEKLKTSLEEFGYIEPIIVNDVNNHVVGGNQRLRALIALGYDEVDCVYVHIEDINKEKACNVALNKISGDWDEDKLRTVLEDIELSPIDIKLTGFDELELTELEVKEPITVHEDDFIIEDEEDMEVNVKEGDLFRLGEHYLLCGDSTVEANVKKLMQGAKADISFTSPPYNLGATGEFGNKNKAMNVTGSSPYKTFDDDLTNDDYTNLLIKAMENSLKYAEDSLFNIGILANSKIGIINLLKTFEDNFCDLLVWKKDKCLPLGNPTQSGCVNHLCEFIFCFNEKGNRAFNNPQWKQGTQTNIIETVNATGNSYAKIHGATFPIDLPSYIIQNFSKYSVLDLFGGTGTTLIAAEQLHRQCYMMELDPYYCQVIINRWEEYTGRKAEKLPL